ncbi:MAG: hypothetical protein Q9162_002325 [Coniocarpon cinnabarinum]
MATGVQTDNAFTLLDQVVHDGGGGGPVTHTHTQAEGMYIVSGQCSFNAGGHQGLTAPAGTFVAVPADTEHSFTVDAPNTHMLNFYLPAGFEQLLMGISHPAPERKPPPQDRIQEMLPPAWLVEKLSADYGQEPRPANPFTTPPDPALMRTKPTPGATVFPYTTHADKSSRYRWMNASWAVLADGERTGGSYCLFEVQCTRGTLFPPRLYQERAEVIYVLEGELRVLLGDHIRKATKGAMAFVPAGSVMSVHVNSAEARLLDLHADSGFERVVRFHSSKAKNSGNGSPSHSRPREADEAEQRKIHHDIGLSRVPVEVSWSSS